MTRRLTTLLCLLACACAAQQVPFAWWGKRTTTAASWVPLPGNLKLWYGCNYDGDTNDLSGSGNHCQLVHAPVWSDNAYDFDGANDYAVTPLVPNGWTAITVCVWCKADVINGTDRVLWYAGAGTSTRGGVAHRTAPMVSLYLQAGTVDMTQTYTGQWHHLAYTWQLGSGTSAWAYSNAVLETTYNSFNSAMAATNSFRWCNDQISGATYNFNGKSDSLMIWDRALSAAQVGAVYSNTGPNVTTEAP